MTALNKQALREAAEKATPGRVGDRIDGSGSIKYECHGYDGSLVLRTDHKNMEYGFIGDNGNADELFFRLCVPDVVLALLDELEAAERRIAELEAQTVTVKLPELCVGVVQDGHAVMVPYAAGHWFNKTAILEMLVAAGIGVKQQQDSVDSDVGSRNQPGMVVAVHIDAGDFVKVKGQVFEVEETDFDDHDVTLWFVGGNALKCAAGCQVEVVAAPVDAGIGVKGE
ncbi:ead/Ea22-like family protein [Citrobacter freundii]